MPFQWEFFENYNGGFYVTELETNRLVYMNACLRRSLGFEQGYKGLLCHEVLQGKERPCDFCNNHALEEGKFISWIYQDTALNKEFLLNDTMVVQDGKRYRVEMTVDLSMDSRGKAPFYTRYEQILNECLRRMFATADENQAIDMLLKYIGETFASERVYIFEVADEKKVNNTYEWCAPGVVPQKMVLQNAPYDVVAFWFDIFDRDGVLTISDLEEMRESHPLTYAYLQTQGIRSLMVGPIRGDRGYMGFIGVANPGQENQTQLSPLIQVIGCFLSVLLKRRDMTNQLLRQSYCDPLTGVYNRLALSERFSGGLEAQSLGIVYCDISGLKQVNDLYGHDAGDELILRSCRLIASVMGGAQMFRVGGDEFVVLCLNLTQEDFERQVELLREKISNEQYHIAVGKAWTRTFPASFDELIKQADQEMYRDKEEYYCSCSEEEQRARDRRKAAQVLSVSQLEKMFPAWTTSDPSACICMGDCQSKRYYISEGMRKAFGFPSNIVYDFFTKWEERIIGYQQKQMFRNDLQQSLEEKRPTMHFAYPMQDGAGNVVMVQAYGMIQWDETYTTPVTFLGCARMEEGVYMTDPVTALPTLQCAAGELEELGETTTVLLFKLNHFGKINESKGREVGNQLLKNIAAQLRSHFRERATFYRLEGLKFMGVLRSGQRLHQEFIDAIRGIVSKQYSEFSVAVAESVTFMPIEYSNQRERPLDLLCNVSALISAAEFHPVSRAIANSRSYLDGLKREINMEFALVHAIQNHMANFRIMVQPVVSAQTGEIAGGEVLLRWTFQGRDVSPGVFIPLIEQEKLMGVVGKWVLEQTVQCCRSISVYRPDMFLSFNVSYQQILGYDFAQTIQTMLDKYNIDGCRIVAELTETYEDQDPIRLQNFIDACGTMGVRIALDDFGKGYSSLGLLLKYSAQTIKLDRSILGEMTRSHEKERFVHGLVESCHRLNKLVCVEGVEVEEELLAATQAGCDFIQGYYYYRPMELRDLFREVRETAPAGGAPPPTGHTPWR